MCHVTYWRWQWVCRKLHRYGDQLWELVTFSTDSIVRSVTHQYRCAYTLFLLWHSWLVQSHTWLQPSLLGRVTSARAAHSLTSSHQPTFVEMSSVDCLFLGQFELGQTNFSHASAWFVCPFPSGKSGVQSKIMSQGVTEPIFRWKKTTITGNSLNTHISRSTQWKTP